MQPSETLKEALVQVFRAVNGGATEQQEHDFVFHLLECSDELCEFADLCRDPHAVGLEKARKIVAALVYHTSGHLAQAARLYDYFPDPFAAGASNSER
jgi:hypothetical protein